MKRRRIRHSENHESGTWWLPKNAVNPYLFCPDCGRALLGDNAPHTIDDNGDVNASVVCRHPGCGFHEFVTLWGWKCECNHTSPYGFVVMADCPYHDTFDGYHAYRACTSECKSGMASLTGHKLHCYACDQHLTSLMLCPSCGKRFD